jgi:hypothetical protein
VRCGLHLPTVHVFGSHTPVPFLRGFEVLMATLQSGGDSSAQYATLLAALDRFENAIFSALNIPRDTPMVAA